MILLKKITFTYLQSVKQFCKINTNTLKESAFISNYVYQKNSLPLIQEVNYRLYVKILF